MKIRSGFVSNSSSSSFLIFGKDLDVSDKILDNLKLTDAQKEDLEDEGNWYLCEMDLKHLGINENIEFQTAYDSDELYVGRSWDTVGDDETGREFKESVNNALTIIFGKKTKGETYSEAWYG